MQNWKCDYNQGLVWLQGRDIMDSGLSPQDKKDLDKFIKFFALKVRSQFDDVALLFPAESSGCICSGFQVLVKQYDADIVISGTCSIAITAVCVCSKSDFGSAGLSLSAVWKYWHFSV